MDERLVSDHAIKRIRERLGLPKAAAMREAQRVMSEGMPISEAGGRLRRYLYGLRILHSGADFRITPAAVYALRFGALATVYPWPLAHKKQAAIQWQKWRDSTC